MTDVGVIITRCTELEELRNGIRRLLNVDGSADVAVTEVDADEAGDDEE